MMRVAATISRLEKHIAKAKELSRLDLADELVFDALAMECFQAVNSAIDLGELIVTERNLGFPAKYREIFELLHNAKLIGRKTFESTKRLVFLRNLVSHEYYAITKEELREMASLLGVLDELIASARKLKVNQK